MNEANDPISSVHTRHSIWRMYRDAADEDYLIARFSARSNLLYQFWWSAQQAVEKYLKAALLLNGKPVRSYGHKLLEMYGVALDFSGDLLPILLCPPAVVRQRIWPNTNPRGFLPTEKFVSLLQTNGNPHNRYRTFSTYTKPEYLIYFDELCFCLRRIAFPLDLEIDSSKTLVRSELTRNRGLQLHPTMSFEGSMSSKYQNVWKEHFRVRMH
ncbi:MAG: HEPN domain-containing protein [Loktanella sp.]|nr:HEPN domain-containing protein [Loktanella sp.]